MAVKDPDSDLYSGIQLLLTKDNDWPEYFPARNCVWYNLVSGEQNELPTVATDAEFPSFKMWHLSGANKMFLEAVTMATFASANAPPAHWLEQPSTVLRMEMVSDYVTLQGSNKGKAVTVQALRRGGPKLGGVSNVRGFQYTYNVKRVDDPETAHGQFRWVTTMDLTVFMSYQGESYV